MRIRRAQLSDLPIMVELLCELFAIEDDFTIDRAKHVRGLTLLLENPDAIVLVVENENYVIGMASVQPLISTAIGERVGLIEDVVIASRFRGKGLGRELIERLIDETQKAGMKRLALGADERNAGAIEFYKKFGFTTSHMGLMYRKN